MKRLALAFALIFSLTLVTAPADADAQTVFELGPRVGIDVGDFGEPYLGADVRITSPGLPVIINPTFDFYFTPENSTFWGLSGNILFPFGIDNEVFTPYAGAGLGIFRASIGDGDFSDTNIGLNLLFGAKFITGGPVTPFAEAHFTPIFGGEEATIGGQTIQSFGSENLFGIRGGILFGL